jgi:chromosome segregation protein
LEQGEKDYHEIEVAYNEINQQYNNFNLNVTRQQSKINALKQELQFKTNQLNDLRLQVQNNTQQLTETSGNIETLEATLERSGRSYAGPDEKERDRRKNFK